MACLPSPWPLPRRARAQAPAASLVVGDSLEELTSPYLQRYLPGVPLTVNAVGGSNSYQILDLFEESYDPSQSVIVFDAGTNDNPAYPRDPGRKPGQGRGGDRRQVHGRADHPWLYR